MASTSHGHSALQPYMVQLVLGSPFKQGKQVINTDRSFHDVFDALEWGKGYSLLGGWCEACVVERHYTVYLSMPTLPHDW